MLNNVMENIILYDTCASRLQDWVTPRWPHVFIMFFMYLSSRHISCFSITSIGHGPDELLILLGLSPYIIFTIIKNTAMSRLYNILFILKAAPSDDTNAELRMHAYTNRVHTFKQNSHLSQNRNHRRILASEQWYHRYLGDSPRVRW